MCHARPDGLDQQAHGLVSDGGKTFDPQHVVAHLPWSLEFAMTAATSVGSVVAQGDSDSISCRIVSDGVVKAEKITREVHAFTFCLLKAE